LIFVSKIGYDNIICESNYLEAVELIIAGRDHALHTYVTETLHIKDVLHGNSNTTLCMFLENKICVKTLWLWRDHIKGVGHAFLLA